jgi:hypothetical protein
MSKRSAQSPATTVWTVRLLAEEGVAGWTVGLWWYGHDDEGQAHDGGHLTTVVSIPKIDSELDQAWLVLVTALHMLEEAGSVGSLRGGWRRPDIG